MASKTFSPGTTIDSAWLNDVNTQTYKQEVNALVAGIVGDGITDNSTVMQAALTSLAATGGVLYLPVTTGAYVFSTTLNVPSGVTIRGDGKWATILKYTGSGSAFTSTSNVNVGFRNFTLQLSATNAIGIDASRFISSTFESIRITTVSGTGQTGISANITNVAWTSYFNVAIDITFDGLATGLTLNSSVAQQPNRWRIIAPTFLSCTDCFNLQVVKGIQVVAPIFNEHTGYAIKTGASAERLKFVAITMESSSGGTLFNINAATNRLEVLGYTIFAGTDGSASGIGIRGFIVADWDTGIQWSGTSTATAISKLLVQDNVGVQATGIESLSSTTTQGKNLAGTVTFASAASAAVTFARTEPDASYRILITGRANENFWIEPTTPAPSTTGFTVKSSNATSTAQVDWMIVR